MYDLHCHILPGVDDGPESLEEALAMARLAVHGGTQVVVATPHGFELGKLKHKEEVLLQVAQLQRRLEEEEIPLRVVPGVENYLTPDLPQQLADGRAFTLDDTRYCLIEFPLFQRSPFTEQVLFDLQVRGLTPIIAHPERYLAFQQDQSLLERLVQRGMLAQLTAGSLLGTFGEKVRKTARALLERRLVHVIASDAHSPRPPRTPLLEPGLEVASKLVGPERAWAMVTTLPAAVLANQEVTVEPPEPVSSRRSWFFWRS